MEETFTKSIGTSKTQVSHEIVLMIYLYLYTFSW